MLFAKTIRPTLRKTTIHLIQMARGDHSRNYQTGCSDTTLGNPKNRNSLATSAQGREEILPVGSPDPRIQFNDLQEGRYDRQEQAAWWDQSRVRSARVIVAGAGALSNEVLKCFALMGVGHVRVVDFDTVSPSNLSRMVLFRAEDVGRPKVEVAAERMRQINPDVEVIPVNGDLEYDIGLGDYRSASIVLGCLDSVNARWALNRKCLRAGVDWINGGISDFHGVVERYGPKGEACYECTFSDQTYARFNQKYSCPFGLLADQEGNKVPTTAVTTSIIAAFQVQQALLAIHGMQGGLNAGERMTVYMNPYRMTVDRLTPGPHCLAHNPQDAEITRTAFTNQNTIREVIASQAMSNVFDRLVLDYDLLVEFHCPACGTSQAVLRPKRRVRQAEAACPNCGGTRIPVSTSEITVDSPLAERTLAEIGIPAREILTLGGGFNCHLQIN